MCPPRKKQKEADDEFRNGTPKEHGHLGGLLAGKIGDNRYAVDYAVDNRAKCRDPNCKLRLPKGSLRIGKIPPAFKLGHSNRTQWYHLECLFRSFRRMCKHSRIISSVNDIEGFDELKPDDQERIQLCLLKYSTAQDKPFEADTNDDENKKQSSSPDAYAEQINCANVPIPNNLYPQTSPFAPSPFQAPQLPFPALPGVSPASVVATTFPLLPLTHLVHQSTLVAPRLINKAPDKTSADGKSDFDKVMEAWWHDMLHLQQLQQIQQQQPQQAEATVNKDASSSNESLSNNKDSS